MLLSWAYKFNNIKINIVGSAGSYYFWFSGASWMIETIVYIRIHELFCV